MAECIEPRIQRVRIGKLPLCCLRNVNPTTMEATCEKTSFLGQPISCENNRHAVVDRDHSGRWDVLCRTNGAILVAVWFSGLFVDKKSAL